MRIAISTGWFSCLGDGEVAPTLIYDTKMLGDAGSGKPFGKEKWPNVTMPALVMSGSKSPRWSQNSMRHLAEVLVHGTHRSLPGQTHLVTPSVLAEALVAYFT